MVKFDIDKTEIIFFDLEFYVPKEDRSQSGASMNFNPNKRGHLLLGGVFARVKPLKDIMKEPELTHIWIWKEGDEKQVITKIYEYFQECWKPMANKDAEQADLILCGTGITRSDIPVLYIKSIQHGIDTPANLFDCFFKAKPVDFSEATIPYFRPEPRILYPKTTNRILEKFKIRSFKDSSTSVWDLYDNREHARIEKRTTHEVLDILEIYNKFLERIYGINVIESFTVKGTPTTKTGESEWINAVKREVTNKWDGKSPLEPNSRIILDVCFHLRKKPTDYHDNLSDLDNLLSPTIDAIASIILPIDDHNKNPADYLIYKIIAEKDSVEEIDEEGATIIVLEMPE